MYEIKWGWFWFQKIKKVKGHGFLKSDGSIMVVECEDKKTHFLDLRKHSPITFSDGWLNKEEEEAKKESQGTK